MTIRKIMDKLIIILMIVCIFATISILNIPNSNTDKAYANGEIDDSVIGTLSAAILILCHFQNYETMTPENEAAYSYTYEGKQKLLFAVKKKNTSTEVLNTFTSKVYNSSTTSLSITGKTTSTKASTRSDIMISTGINNSSASDLVYEVKEQIENYFDRDRTVNQYQNTTFNLPVDGSLPYGTYAVRDIGVGYWCRYYILSLETLYQNNQPYLSWQTESQQNVFEVEKSYFRWQKID